MNKLFILLNIVYYNKEIKCSYINISYINICCEKISKIFFWKKKNSYQIEKLNNENNLLLKENIEKQIEINNPSQIEIIRNENILSKIEIIRDISEIEIINNLSEIGIINNKSEEYLSFQENLLKNRIVLNKKNIELQENIIKILEKKIKNINF